MTYGEALKKGTEVLRENGIEDASVDAWYLLEYCCGMSRTRYLLEKCSPIPPSEQETYEALLRKRSSHIPLQHITGEQEFMGLTFLVNDQVLIPRQDTEILVEEALKVTAPGMKVLDLCTGSGCILISLMKFCPGLLGTAADLSGEALKVAQKNAERQNVTIRFCQSDLFEAITESFDVIVSNPPYIPTDEIDQLMEEVRLHDPRMALDGKEDGLYFYRKITEESDRCLNAGGWLLFEIGCEQAKAVADMMREKKFSKVRVIKDLAGLDRVVIGQREKMEERHV